MSPNQLIFPGNKTNYLAFNVVSGDTQSWQDMWPRIAKRFGARIPERMLCSDPREAYNGYEAAGMDQLERPPVKEYENEMGLKDEFEQNHVHYQINLAKWAQVPEVVKA